MSSLLAPVPKKDLSTTDMNSPLGRAGLLLHAPVLGEVWLSQHIPPLGLSAPDPQGTETRTLTRSSRFIHGGCSGSNIGSLWVDPVILEHCHAHAMLQSTASFLRAADPDLEAATVLWRCLFLCKALEIFLLLSKQSLQASQSNLNHMNPQSLVI